MNLEIFSLTANRTLGAAGGVVWLTIHRGVIFESVSLEGVRNLEGISVGYYAYGRTDG